MKHRPVIAIDAMGGDRAPEAIVAGGARAADELGVSVVLVGDETAIRACLSTPGGLPERVTILHASEVIEMADEPASSVRNRRDSSIVRAAELVRDGTADAFVGAGNTGATMAAALLRFGRIRGIARPAIAVPLPIPGSAKKQLLVDGGATTDPEPEWLVQWAKLAQAYASARFGIEHPTVALLSNGEEAGKGDALRKQASDLLRSDVADFIGNVEGRDLSRECADVVVTDGFTGNVALKTLEGAMLSMAGLVFSVLDEAAFVEHSMPIKLRLLEAAADLMPDATGGALLLGVRGICVISHGSSSPDAIVNACRVAKTCVESNVVERLSDVVAQTNIASVQS